MSKLNPSDVVLTYEGIDVTRLDATLLRRVNTHSNQCCEVTNQDAPALLRLYEMGALKRTNVRVIFCPPEPGVALTAFGKLLVAELDKIAPQ